MTRIASERLIELAETGALPTALEQHALENDPALRHELEELHLLFTDLRELPAAPVTERAMAAILPGVRTRIDQHRRRIFGIAAWLPQPAWNAAFATLSVTIIVALLTFGNVNAINLDNVSTELFASDNGSNLVALQLEASSFNDLDLLAGMEQDIPTATLEDYIYESTDSLMAQAASTDAATFKQIAARLAQEGH